MRKHVCDILEGGDRAFKGALQRLRIHSIDEDGR